MADKRPKKTNEDLWEFLEKIAEDTKSCKSQLDSALQAVKNLENKFEEKIDTVTKRQDSLEANSCTKDELQAVASVLKNDMKEENERYLRKNNVVVFGLLEDDEGKHLYDRLMRIIGDHITIEPQTTRIGHPKNPKRPLRVYLPPGSKGELMSKLVRLKGLDDFKSVNVKHDLTRLQREARVRSPIRTRSKSAGENTKAALPGGSGDKKAKNARSRESSSPEPEDDAVNKAKKARTDSEKDNDEMETVD